jgi:hypothetical protein
MKPAISPRVSSMRPAETPAPSAPKGSRSAPARSQRHPPRHRRRLDRLKEVEHWSLTTLREKLVKIGARIRHGRYVVFQLAEVAVPRALVAEILRRIERLRPRPPPF